MKKGEAAEEVEEWMKLFCVQPVLIFRFEFLLDALA
jgi:hydroxyacyl-ACP dehydratase HTD2-like protein with hotdog domain